MQEEKSMPTYQATEAQLNATISALSDEDLTELKKRINGERADLDIIAEEVRIFAIRYGRLPSALNNS